MTALPRSLDRYKKIVVYDFEFLQPNGHKPKPRCLVAKELRSGREVRLWGDELAMMRKAPFNTGSDTLPSGSLIGHHRL